MFIYECSKIFYLKKALCKFSFFKTHFCTEPVKTQNFLQKENEKEREKLEFWRLAKMSRDEVDIFFFCLNFLELWEKVQISCGENCAIKEQHNSGLLEDHPPTNLRLIE